MGKCSICDQIGHNKRTCKVKISKNIKQDHLNECIDNYISTNTLTLFKKNKRTSPNILFICSKYVIPGSLITKSKRHELFGKIAGGSGSRKPEEFQREMIKKGTGANCPKTNVRINIRKWI